MLMLWEQGWLFVDFQDFQVKFIKEVLFCEFGCCVVVGENQLVVFMDEVGDLCVVVFGLLKLGKGDDEFFVVGEYECFIFCWL